VKGWLCAMTLMLCAFGTTAKGAEIRVVASPGLSGAFGVLGPQFEHASGNTLSLRYGLIPAQKQFIESGDFDLAVVPSIVLDDAIKDGKIAADTRTLIARVELGVGIRAGAGKSDLSSVDAFKRAMLAAKSVSYVINEPTGKQISKDFETLGIAEEMTAKTKAAETTTQVWRAVAGGDAELGFGFISNIVSAQGVEVAGSVPRELQYSILMQAGIGTAARETDAAKSFITYLLGTEAGSVLKSQGLAPSGP
jgi:molybdate transport system substrate-binding protein